MERENARNIFRFSSLMEISVDSTGMEIEVNFRKDERDLPTPLPIKLDILH